MSESLTISATRFNLTGEQTKKINYLLPSGYKLVTPQEFKKKNLSRPKKKTLMGLPLTPQIVSQSIKLIQTGRKKNIMPPVSQSFPYPSPSIFKMTQKIPIPISLDYYNQAQSSQNISTVATFSRLKNNPLIQSLYKVSMPYGHLSFKDIERRVNTQKQNYKINEMIGDISKICLKVYQSESRQSNQYQNTVSIQKYLNSLTRTEKVEPILITPNFSRQSSMGVKKKIVSRIDNQNAVITIKQKRQLGQRIKKLPSQCLQQICLIVFQNLQNKQYSFDLDTLHLKKIRQLQDYVNSRSQISQLKEINQDFNRDQIDEGEESSFIIEGDGQEPTNNNQYDF